MGATAAAGLRALHRNSPHSPINLVALQAFSHAAAVATPTAIKRAFRHVPYNVWRGGFYSCYCCCCAFLPPFFFVVVDSTSEAEIKFFWL